MIYVLLFVTGIIFWTFLEYVIHRFFGHQKKKGIIKKEHSKHHSHRNYFVATYKKIGLALLVVAICTFLLSFISNFYMALFFSLGLVITYLLYENAHYCFHVIRPVLKRYGLKMRKHHFYHHFQNPNKNHGVTTAFWDRVFKTYQPVDKVFVPKSMSMYWLFDTNKQDIKEEFKDHFVVRGI